jgi:hypothetical protein
VVMPIGNPFSGEITFEIWQMEKLVEYFKQLRVARMAIAVIWSILPMPIAEEIEPHVMCVIVANEKQHGSDTVVNPKRRRINE